MKNKILITGACGFIGSHLVETLIKKNFSIVAFDRYNINNDYGWLQHSKYIDEIEFILGDVRDFDSVNHAMKNCNSCIHLAALIGIPYSYISPLAYLRTNIEGTYNILEASKNNEIEQVIITSTSETYGSAQYEPIDEKHPLVGQSPYSASKIGADQLSLSYYRSFNLPVKLIRPFNVFGPRQSSRAIIPTIISQLINKKSKIQLGNIYTKRDFTYVLDTCDAYLEIFQNQDTIGETYNVGSNKNISILDLFELIKQKININSEIEVVDSRKRKKTSEVDSLICDNSKLLKHTNWFPKHNFNESIDTTIEWVKQNIIKFDSSNYHV